MVVARTAVLVIGAWILWAYFAVRYIQYLKAEGNLGLRDAIEVEMLRLFKQGNPLEPHKDSWGQQFNWVLVRESVGRWCVRLEHYDPAVSEVQSSSLPVPILRGWWWWLKAACGVAWTTPKFTDFVLPLALAAMAPVVSIWFYFAACPACVEI